MEAVPKRDHFELVNLFLENACADPLLANGPAAHLRRSHTSHRILKHHPEIARENIHTAVVCGDIQEVDLDPLNTTCSRNRTRRSSKTASSKGARKTLDTASSSLLWAVAIARQ
jgi:hypothetical protein